MSLQGERGTDGDPGTPGVPVSVDLHSPHWVAVKLFSMLRFSSVFEIYVQVCSELQGPMDGKNISTHHLQAAK